MSWTTDDLLAEVRRAIFAPDTSDQSDTDLLRFGDQALNTLIAASVRAGRGEHWLYTLDHTIVPGTVEYDMPRRALGRTLRGVVLVSSSGESRALQQVDALRLREAYSSTSTSGMPQWYAFEGEKVRLGVVPSSGTWTLRLFYLMSPPRLIPTTSATSITSVTLPVTLVVAADPLPSGLTFVDIVSGTEPYRTIVLDNKVASFSAPTVTLTTSVSASAGVANARANRQPDYLVPAEQTVYPPIPRPMWPALVSETARLALRAVRDPQAASMAVEAQAHLGAARDIMNPRENRASMKIVGSSPMRWVGRRRWSS